MAVSFGLRAKRQKLSSTQAFSAGETSELLAPVLSPEEALAESRREQVLWACVISDPVHSVDPPHCLQTSF